VADDEEQSSWAPDGRRIAFKRSDEVFVRDVTTDAAPVRLTAKTVRTENNTQPGWSPDGASIVFRTNRADPTQNVGDIWIMNADGSDERPLVVQEGDQRYPALSPDGTRLVYTSRSEGGTSDLWMANADGTDAHELFDSGREDSAPAWSPDGHRIAFEIHGPVGGVDGDIYVLDLDTGKVTQLTGDPADAPIHDEGPAWSPDGRMIAFTSEREDPDGDIWVMNADGSDPRRLTDNTFLDESPDWQPLPFSVGAPGHPSVASGDLSTVPGGVASVTAVKMRCNRALRVAARWSPGRTRVEGFACTRTPHSFDQEIVTCEHMGGRRGVAFVWRRPAS
jgi:TolB protein